MKLFIEKKYFPLGVKTFSFSHKVIPIKQSNRFH